VRALLKTLLFVVAPVGLAAYITAALLRRADLDFHSVMAFGSARMHGLALSVAVADMLCRGGRTHLLARGLKRDLPLRYGLLVQMAADGAAAVTPARMGADPAKFFVLRSRKFPVGASAVMLAGEGLSEAFVIGMISIFLALTFDVVRAAALALLVYPVTLACVVAFAAIGAHRLRRTIVRMLPVPFRFKRDAVRAAHGFIRNLRQILTLRPQLTLAILFVTFLHVIARAAMLPVLLAGFAKPGSALEIVVWPLAVQYGGSLIPVPSGGGGIEAGLAFALRDVVPAAALLPALVWWRVYTFYLGAITGLLALSVFRHRHAQVSVTRAGIVTEAG
jgi:uncharacterized protein (TIRG00374 family)